MVLSSLALLLGIAVAPASIKAQTLPLDESLTSLLSPEGQQLLQESEAQTDYVPLASQFVTQQNQAFCGIASTVMILNALGIPAPEAPEWERQYFTQENIFNPATEAVIERSLIERQGLTLAELAGIISSYPVTVEVLYGAEVTLDEFRQAIATNLAEGDNFVVVNYLRRAIGQETGGHISPIAAYDADTDRFLILDVSRYKYPPVWVEAEALWQATDTIDSVSERSRGVVLVSALE
ncbi:MAG: glutathione gamma-glutamylcysteinyltransferase [Leptolyngbyaceae cyanobacterium SM1_1_3]|nr:glutathione gamma-glutamylcysteinyltransferase [Leptolyngbyaceae cyanobacterium SM1_1_3]NJN03501.1 glutathione gamma-glutamylcysteinyltransferase [Leptolyngbyaceae cyanobacterium RM1_1_2]NJO09475.1 glutathione gamma-glutamylcysteinyltransferase [Leptolyngbyaceae cyanobacterium SL_1_1]